MSHPWLQVSSQLASSLAFAAVSPSIEGDDDVSAVVNRKGVSRAGVADGSIFTHPDTEVTWNLGKRIPAPSRRSHLPGFSHFNLISIGRPTERTPCHVCDNTLTRFQMNFFKEWSSGHSHLQIVTAKSIWHGRACHRSGGHVAQRWHATPIRTSGLWTLQHAGRTSSSGHGTTGNPSNWWYSNPRGQVRAHW